MKKVIKEILRESLNSLGVEVTRPNQLLIVMRGISGSGKSTKAKSLVGEGVIHSTDDLIEATGDYRGFFAEMLKTGNFVNLSRMHSKNLKNAMKSMDEGITPIVIDNTNLRANEAKAYVKHALELGYADENIQIVDIGTGGLTAEGLAARNSHGVPLEKITQMVKTHKSVGPLTVQKILESADMYKASDVLYSCVLLDDKSHGLLLNKFANDIPEGWRPYAHHMTINLGELKDKSPIGRVVTLTVTHVGKSNMAMAALVEGYPSKSENPHVTLAVNPEGGKPAMSKEITNWKRIRSFTITGTVTEIKK